MVPFSCHLNTDNHRGATEQRALSHFKARRKAITERNYIMSQRQIEFLRGLIHMWTYNDDPLTFDALGDALTRFCMDNGMRPVPIEELTELLKKHS